jgi:hypothetical protein
MWRFGSSRHDRTGCYLIPALNLVHRQDFDFRFASVKFDCTGDADDFPLERGNPLVSRYFGPGRNEPSKRLIGVCSSEIDKSRPQRAGRHRDNSATHLYLFADIVNAFRVFYHYWLVRTRHNRAEKQAQNCKERTNAHSKRLRAAQERNERLGRRT